MNGFLFRSMKKLVLLVLLILPLLGGCLTREVDFRLPVYDGHLEGKVEYPLATLAPPGEIWVMVASDPYHRQLVHRVKTTDGNFKLAVHPGKYYLSAYHDSNSDEYWTFGQEAIGGRLAREWDYYRDFQPLVRTAQTITRHPVLLHPFHLEFPYHQEENLGVAPTFRWQQLPGTELWRIRVMDAENKSLWVFDSTRNEIVYASQPAQSGEETLARPHPLFAGTDYYWHVVALREGAAEREVIAYSPTWRFRVTIDVSPQ